MPDPGKDISDWDKTFTARWQAALKREFGTGNVAAHKLSACGLNPATVKSWIRKGGHPTIANLCLVARAAEDPSAFIVDVCGDEPWARELGVALQRRRMGSAEMALAVCRAGLADTPTEVLRVMAGPVRSYRYVTDEGTVTQSLDCPEEGARVMLGMKVTEGATADYVMRNMGWILLEEAADQPAVVHCYGLWVADAACNALVDLLEQEMPRQGAELRVFITDWVAMPCATLYQLAAELQRVRQMRRHAVDDARVGLAPEPAGTPTSERRALMEAPPSGGAFLRLWEQTGGVIDAALIHRIESSDLFDLGGVYGIQDHHFRVAYVGPKLRLPVGVTRERVTGLDVLEVQASRGYGAMLAAHFALAAHERAPVVHLVRVTSQRSYRRVSFPVFDHRGRKVVAVIGFSDARNTEST
ncbi:hypothetical protein [Roseospira goensis]|uniref:Uncharacterized protein n=1 Tax=Roseospira goensis TaxID=391922 RepID=A0A7W6WKJ3_9PROT|nr:hypothetical protein [Roseospira goensis]MBB4285824.1 hypothetical protein [Roseospira goensis]